MPDLDAALRTLSIALLAISAFVIVTTEFLIVGLLRALARDLRVSISTAGQLVTLFAFTVMLFGPFLTAALSHVERKRLFIAIMFVFAAASCSPRCSRPTPISPICRNASRACRPRRSAGG
ncbi:hypothetical protein WI72_30260 [Burkholderia ubonensis]|uniref:MFS transporter n=1 Tax=Burkholderia ubonensis TaxID=101571 RepID=UPI00075694FF|nr:hypothetical protein WI72_30260 [Burkholderia ubonensis]KVD97218.1 hypothetical protein WI90_31480 [Burkholderia ubonensis]